MTKCYEKHMGEPWFTWSKDGIKTVEGRANCGSYSKIKKGDTIVWFNDDCGPDRRRYLKTTVISTKAYKDYPSMLKGEGLRKIIPYKDVKTIKQGETVLHFHCSKETIRKHGVLAVRYKIL